MKNDKAKNFRKRVRGFMSTAGFSCVRLNRDLIIVKPDEHDVCFFVNNTGVQVMDPKTNNIFPQNIDIWEEKKGENPGKQFNSSSNLDKSFSENIIKTIWRLTDDKLFSAKVA